MFLYFISYPIIDYNSIIKQSQINGKIYENTNIVWLLNYTPKQVFNCLSSNILKNSFFDYIIICFHKDNTNLGITQKEKCDQIILLLEYITKKDNTLLSHSELTKLYNLCNVSYGHYNVHDSSITIRRIECDKICAVEYDKITYLAFCEGISKEKHNEIMDLDDISKEKHDEIKVIINNL